MSEIQNGARVVITDVGGEEHETLALSGVERGHKFPIVWVNRPPTKYGEFDPWPWPADSVRLA